jgi:excisionase family DNA binding protein
MENLVFTQLSTFELRQIIREELENIISRNQVAETKRNSDEISGIDLAIEITGLAKPTIYGLCSERKIPHLKQGKKLYFSRQELTEWLKQGKRKTESEIAIEAENFSRKEKAAIQPTKQRNRRLKG